MQKISSPESHESGPSDYFRDELQVDGKDWRVRHLEVKDTELCLELFKSVKETKFGGETWKCIPEAQTFSVAVVVPNGLCKKHAEEYQSFVLKVSDYCIIDIHPN